jgi:hypothetical protein
MALNSSGPISLGGSTAGQSVNLELGQSATAQISFNDVNVRSLTATTAGTALVMPTNFYGKGIATTTSIVAGYEVYSSKVSTTDYYGYSDGDPTIFPPAFGSIGVSVYEGATIKGIWWQSNTSGSSIMSVCLTGNRDLSFFNLLVANGTTYDFTGTTPFYNSSAGYTVFEVDDITNPFPSSGTTYSCALS